MTALNPTISRRNLIGAFGTAAALGALALAGCGSSDAAGASQGSQQDDGSGSTLAVGIASTVSTLSVNQEAGSANYQLAALYQEGLTGVDDDGAVVPALAESWTTDDGTVWTFKLRQGVKFHDGSTLTADDVVDSIATAQDPTLSPGLSTYWPDYVVGAEKTADDEVTITLTSPHGDFDVEVSNVAGLFITSSAFFKEAGSDYGSSKALIVGTGPYRVTEFNPSSHLSLARFEDWWGDFDGPDAVRIDFIGEDSTRLLAFQEGEIDAALNVPVASVEQWQTNGASVSSYSDRSYYGLTFDESVPPFDDIHVRRAVAYALDKQSIVDGILKGYGQVATGIDAPEQLAGWTGNDVDAAQKLVDELPALSFDLDAAAGELAQSSQPDGFEATLTYPTGYATVGQASLALAESLKKVGITLSVSEITLEQWLSEVGDGNQGVAWMIYNPTTPQPNEVSSWLLAAGGAGTNPANWDDADVATQTDTVSTLEDDTERLDIVLATTKTALEEVVYAPAWWGQALVATNASTEFAKVGTYWLGTAWPASFTKA